MSLRATLLLLILPAACARGGPPLPTPDRAAAPVWDTASASTIAPGVSLLAMRARAVPWEARILEIDLASCRPELRARKAGPTLADRARTSTLGSTDLAAINADFFLIPAGTPVGPHVEDGQILAGPGRRPAFVVTRAGWAAGLAALAGSVAHRNDTVSIGQVNRPPEGGPQHPAGTGVVLFTSWFGDSVVAAPALTVRVLDAGDGRAGSAGRGVVAAVADTGTTVESGWVAFRAGTGGEQWMARRAPGDTITWHVQLHAPDGGEVLEAVGGFPIIVEEGRDVVASQEGISESFGPRRHPRTAVGWNERTLFLVVVDGRQSGWSEGMALTELAALFLALGAEEAINLDGGGSTAMAVQGSVVNRPSDSAGERAVGNALALARCR